MTLCVVGALAALAATSNSTAVAAEMRVTARAEPFDVALTLPETTIDARRAVITVTDSTGSPVADAVVVTHATMHGMGHSGEVSVAKELARGRYQISGELFPMTGPWTVFVSIDRDGTTTNGTFPIVIITN